MMPIAAKNQSVNKQAELMEIESVNYSRKNYTYSTYYVVSFVFVKTNYFRMDSRFKIHNATELWQVRIPNFSIIL